MTENKQESDFIANDCLASHDNLFYINSLGFSLFSVSLTKSQRSKYRTFDTIRITSTQTFFFVSLCSISPLSIISSIQNSPDSQIRF